MEFEVGVLPKETAEKLKKKIEKLCGIPADDLELFCKNSEPEAETSVSEDGAHALLHKYDQRCDMVTHIHIHTSTHTQYALHTC